MVVVIVVVEVVRVVVVELITDQVGDEREQIDPWWVNLSLILGMGTMIWGLAFQELSARSFWVLEAGCCTDSAIYQHVWLTQGVNDH